MMRSFLLNAAGYSVKRSDIISTAETGIWYEVY